MLSNEIYNKILASSLLRGIKTSSAKYAGTAATAGEHSGSYKLWKRLSFFVAFPSVGLCMLNAYLKHQEEHHKPRQEFVKYDYLCKRDKRFPWGDGTRSFFHNPHANPLPSGYEA